MHKDQIEGAGKQAKGAIKDAAGQLTGDVGLQAEGKLDKAAGQVQSAVGKAKDDARKETAEFERLKVQQDPLGVPGLRALQGR